MCRKCRLHVTGTQKRGGSNPFTFGNRTPSGDMEVVSDYGVMSEYWKKKVASDGLATFHTAFRDCGRSHGRVALLMTTRPEHSYGAWESVHYKRKQRECASV